MLVVALFQNVVFFADVLRPPLQLTVVAARQYNLLALLRLWVHRQIATRRVAHKDHVLGEWHIWHRHFENSNVHHLKTLNCLAVYCL